MPYHITTEGRNALLKQLNESLRPRLAQVRTLRNQRSVRHASQDDDLYDEEHQLLQQITALEHKLATCDVSPEPDQFETIRIGHVVEAVCSAPAAHAGASVMFHVVGYEEGNVPSDPPQYSYTAAFARPFLGKEVGDPVSVDTPATGRRTYEVRSIRSPKAAPVAMSFRRDAAS